MQGMGRAAHRRGQRDFICVAGPAYSDEYH